MAMVPVSDYGPSPVLPPRAALGPPPAPTEVPRGTNLMGVLLVLVADAMLLAGLLAVWFTLKANSPTWPPNRVDLNTYLPSVVTITAAMSAVFMQWAVSGIRRNDLRSATSAMILTLFFGIAIVNAQWYSLVRADFGVNDHTYGTLYFLLIGYHAVHMTLAVGALILVGSRALVGHFGRHGYDPMRAVAAFWNYSSVAWFAILCAVFLFAPHT